MKIAVCYDEIYTAFPEEFEEGGYRSNYGYVGEISDKQWNDWLEVQEKYHSFLDIWVSLHQEWMRRDKLESTKQGVPSKGFT
jgi:hypothetical protein